MTLDAHIDVTPIAPAVTEPLEDVDAPIVIIGCGKAKRELAPGTEVPIVDLYNGSLYRARMALADALGGADFVLSAAHHLADARTRVATYESDLRKKSRREREHWNDSVLAAFRKSVPRAFRVVVMAAGPYVEWVPVARREGWTIEIPAEGLQLGESIAVLRAAALDVQRGTVVGQADEVECEFSTYLDSERVDMPVPVFRELLRRAAARGLS